MSFELRRIKNYYITNSQLVPYFFKLSLHFITSKDITIEMVFFPLWIWINIVFDLENENRREFF